MAASEMFAKLPFQNRELDFRKHGWKPLTLRSPVLGGFIVVSVATITLLEVLSNLSLREGNGGGIAFAPDVNTLSSLSIFGYLYLPTILAVLYSMTWSWVDLDVKRLEPWFQLSRETGANASDSLLLQYPFDFLPFIPLAALRLRHWGVFFGGTIMLMIFWIVTPLQSAIFTTGTVKRTLSTSMYTSADLMTLDSQSLALTANFVNTGYGISWLNQTLPPFTTHEYAALPFRPVSNASSTSLTETWTADTPIYNTNLTCTTATFTVDSTSSYTFNNGRGCSVPQIALPVTTPLKALMLYIGYYDDPHNDYSLANPNCTIEHSNNFLAVFVPAGSKSTNGVYDVLSAQFCTTSYYVQSSSLTVNASSSAIVGSSIVLQNETQQIEPLQKIMNVTVFECILGVGINAGNTRANFQDTEIVQQSARLESYGLKLPVTNMVGFAVALSSQSIEQFSNPNVLQTAFQAAHQLLFTTAFSTLTQSLNANELRAVRTGIRQDESGAIILVRTISIVVEGALALIILFTASLWALNHQRASRLREDPASIGSVMALIARSDNVIASMRGNDTLTEKQLRERLIPNRYRLYQTNDGSVQVELVNSTSGEVHMGDLLSIDCELREVLAPVRPFELRMAFGIIFCGAILAAIGGISFVNIWSSKKNGISLPSSSAVVRSFIENYAPTAFATLLEPIWTLLNRLLCLLQPFDEPRKGNSKASSSIGVKYTSLPPQLSIMRAARARHFVLAMVCIAVVSTNVLAVALSGLLNEKITTILVPFSSSLKFAPKLNGSPIITTNVTLGVSYFDHFYAAMSNITSGTALPAWVDNKYFYIPFHLDSIPEAKAESRVPAIRGTTIGFGVEFACTELSPLVGNNNVQFDVNQNGSSVEFSTSHLYPNGTRDTCVTGVSGDVDDVAKVNLMPFDFQNKTGPLALEVVHIMTSTSDSSEVDFCGLSITLGWVRVSDEHSNRDVQSSFMSCTQALRVAPFEVFVDMNGRILNSSQTGDFNNDASTYFVGESLDTNHTTSTSLNAAKFLKQSALVIAGDVAFDFAWHNDSFTSDWNNVLLGMMLNSSDLVDPSVSVPNTTALIPVVQDLYQSVFSILLGLNSHVFVNATDKLDPGAQAVILETRLFVSTTMFVLCVTILSLHFLVAVLYYCNRPRRFLPRMPTSIASIMAYVSASRAIQDFGNRGREEESNHHYGYGRYMGTDGKTHVGIERQRYVVPLKSKNPEVKRRGWGFQGTKVDEKEPRTWI